MVECPYLNNTKIILKIKYMKYLFIIVLALVSNIALFAQNSFNKTYYDSYHKNTNYISEINDNQYIIVGNRIDSNLLSDQFFMLIDSVGNIIKDTLIVDTTADMTFTEVLRRNDDEILIFGLKMQKNTFNDSLQVFYYDNNLNYIKHYSYLFSNNCGIRDLKSYLDSKSNIIFSGSSKVDNLLWHSFILKIDSNNNLIARNDTFYNDRSQLPSVLDMEEDSCYLVFGEGVTPGYKYQMYKFDYDLNLMSHDSIKNGLTNYYNPIYYRKNEIIHIGQKRKHMSSTFDFGVCILDSNLNSKYFVQYGVDDTTEFPAAHESISKFENNVFIGATYNDSPYIAQNKTKYMLIKMDTNYNVIWEKYYLGDDYDGMTNVIATSDGGCLMGGLHVDMNPESDNTLAAIRLLKIDSNGIITWTRDIKTQYANLSIYPNPTTDYINIISNGSIAMLDLCIVDINAKQVLYKKINSQQARIDVSELSSGVYFVEGKNRAGMRFKGKFIKK